jgi:hypothetical protein
MLHVYVRSSGLWRSGIQERNIVVSLRATGVYKSFNTLRAHATAWEPTTTHGALTSWLIHHLMHAVVSMFTHRRENHRAGAHHNSVINACGCHSLLMEFLLP